MTISSQQNLAIEFPRILDARIYLNYHFEHGRTIFITCFPGKLRSLLCFIIYGFITSLINGVLERYFCLSKDFCPTI